MNFLWYSVKISAAANPCHNLMVRPIISSDWLAIFLLRLILPRWWPVFVLSGSMAMVYFFLWRVSLAARLWSKLSHRLYRKDNHSSVRAYNLLTVAASRPPTSQATVLPVLRSRAMPPLVDFNFLYAGWNNRFSECVCALVYPLISGGGRNSQELG